VFQPLKQLFAFSKSPWGAFSVTVDEFDVEDWVAGAEPESGELPL
jgi:hypothetical protein